MGKKPCLRRKVILIISFTILLSLVSHKNVWAQKEIRVVTTIGQITDVVRIVGGRRVLVHGLIAPSVDPTAYQASEVDVKRLSEADIVFYVGLSFESRLEDVIEKTGRFKPAIAVGEAIPKGLLINSESIAGRYDPHIWFDVPFWMRVTIKIRDALTRFDPYGRGDFFINAQRYLKELEQLHEYVSLKAKNLPQEKRVLVTFHDAFRYFGRKYDFKLVGLRGISPEAQADAKNIIQLADLISERRIKAVFVDPLMPKESIKILQETILANGWEVKIGELFSDTMGEEGTFEGTYIGMITHNINVIIDRLKK